MKRILSLCIMVLMGLSAFAQQSGSTPFNGLVINEAGSGVGKMKVQVKGTSKRTTSDKEGRFGLTDVPGDAVLQFQFKKIKFEIPVQGRRSMRVIMVGGRFSKAEESQELIDTGFGYVSRREQTRGGDAITGEQLRSMGQQDLEEALLGVVPSLQLVNGQLTVRGSSSINASTAPLILVDGVETTSLSSVSINEVESVAVHRDGSMYGARGANGVIIVKLISHSE